MPEPKEFSGYIQRDERLEFEDMDAEKEKIINEIKGITLYRGYDEATEALANWHLSEVKRSIEEYKTIFFCTCDKGGE